jgi:hypothetical protein
MKRTPTDTKRSSDMGDFAFYEADIEPKRFRWIVVPLRKLLRRLLGPVWSQEELLFHSLNERIAHLETELSSGAVSSRIEDGIEDVRVDLRGRQEASTELITQRLADLERQVETLTGLGWDHVAVVRRLASIEDHMADLPPVESPASVTKAQRSSE